MQFLNPFTRPRAFKGAFVIDLLQICRFSHFRALKKAWKIRKFRFQGSGSKNVVGACFSPSTIEDTLKLRLSSQPEGVNSILQKRPETQFLSKLKARIVVVSHPKKITSSPLLDES